MQHAEAFEMKCLSTKSIPYKIDNVPNSLKCVQYIEHAIRMSKSKAMTPLNMNIKEPKTENNNHFAKQLDLEHLIYFFNIFFV